VVELLKKYINSTAFADSAYINRFNYLMGWSDTIAARRRFSIRINIIFVIGISAGILLLYNSPTDPLYPFRDKYMLVMAALMLYFWMYLAFHGAVKERVKTAKGKWPYISDDVSFPENYGEIEWIWLIVFVFLLGLLIGGCGLCAAIF
jgi:hypothetical protein